MQRTGCTVIVENDESQWDDQTGAVYHYPKRYAEYLLPGTLLLYYKGRLKDPQYGASRLTSEPHYFGSAVAGKSYPDRASTKGDLFAIIESYTPFQAPIRIRDSMGDYLEQIPPSRTSNYWRDGVRPISLDTYNRIVGHSLAVKESEPQKEGSVTSDQQELMSSLEGEAHQVFTTIYERDPRLRKIALLIHGTSCAACGFNFGAHYGPHGDGYIHIHHCRPVSTLGCASAVDPETDLVPLCPNCHAMIHRNRNRTLSVDELRTIINRQ